MRISTSSMFESNVSRINDTQSNLAKIQQRTQRRVQKCAITSSKIVTLPLAMAPYLMVMHHLSGRRAHYT